MRADHSAHDAEVAAGMKLDPASIDAMVMSAWTNRRAGVGGPRESQPWWRLIDYDVVYCAAPVGDQVRVYLRGELIFTKDAEGTGLSDFWDLDDDVQWKVQTLWRRISRPRHPDVAPICGAKRRDGGLCHGRPEPPNGRCKRHFGGHRHSKDPRNRLTKLSEVEAVLNQGGDK